MSKPMKYIRDLEAVGFQRNQAEAQVQMVLDAIEGDLATKADLIHFQEKTENQLTLSEQRTKQNMLELEYRMTTRLGVLVISTTSIAVALLTWLIKT